MTTNNINITQNITEIDGSATEHAGNSILTNILRITDITGTSVKKRVTIKNYNCKQIKVLNCNTIHLTLENVECHLVNATQQALITYSGAHESSTEAELVNLQIDNLKIHINFDADFSPTELLGKNTNFDVLNHIRHPILINLKHINNKILDFSDYSMSSLPLKITIDSESNIGTSEFSIKNLNTIVKPNKFNKSVEIVNLKTDLTTHLTINHENLEIDNSNKNELASLKIVNNATHKIINKFKDCVFYTANKKVFDSTGSVTFEKDTSENFLILAQSDHNGNNISPGSTIDLVDDLKNCIENICFVDNTKANNFIISSPNNDTYTLEKLVLWHGESYERKNSSVFLENSGSINTLTITFNLHNVNLEINGGKITAGNNSHIYGSLGSTIGSVVHIKNSVTSINLTELKMYTRGNNTNFITVPHGVSVGSSLTYNIESGTTVDISDDADGIYNLVDKKIYDVVAGKEYTIVDSGNSAWTALGANDGNAGTVFKANSNKTFHKVKFVSSAIITVANILDTDTITFDPPEQPYGEQAVGTLEVLNGEITGINFSNEGSGYTQSLIGYTLSRPGNTNFDFNTNVTIALSSDDIQGSVTEVVKLQCDTMKLVKIKHNESSNRSISLIKKSSNPFKSNIHFMNDNNIGLNIINSHIQVTNSPNDDGLYELMHFVSDDGNSNDSKTVHMYGEINLNFNSNVHIRDVSKSNAFFKTNSVINVNYGVVSPEAKCIIHTFENNPKVINNLNQDVTYMLNQNIDYTFNVGSNTPSSNNISIETLDNYSSKIQPTFIDTTSSKNTITFGANADIFSDDVTLRISDESSDIFLSFVNDPTLSVSSSSTLQPPLAALTTMTLGTDVTKLARASTIMKLKNTNFASSLSNEQFILKMLNSDGINSTDITFKLTHDATVADITHDEVHVDDTDRSKITLDNNVTGISVGMRVQIGSQTTKVNSINSSTKVIELADVVSGTNSTVNVTFNQIFRASGTNIIEGKINLTDKNPSSSDVRQLLLNMLNFDDNFIATSLSVSDTSPTEDSGEYIKIIQYNYGQITENLPVHTSSVIIHSFYLDGGDDVITSDEKHDDDSGAWTGGMNISFPSVVNHIKDFLNATNLNLVASNNANTSALDIKLNQVGALANEVKIIKLDDTEVNVIHGITITQTIGQNSSSVITLQNSKYNVTTSNVIFDLSKINTWDSHQTSSALVLANTLSFNLNPGSNIFANDTGFRYATIGSSIKLQLSNNFTSPGGTVGSDGSFLDANDILRNTFSLGLTKFFVDDSNTYSLKSTGSLTLYANEPTANSDGSLPDVSIILNDCHITGLLLLDGNSEKYKTTYKLKNNKLTSDTNGCIQIESNTESSTLSGSFVTGSKYKIKHIGTDTIVELSGLTSLGSSYNVGDTITQNSGAAEGTLLEAVSAGATTCKVKVTNGTFNHTDSVLISGTNVAFETSGNSVTSISKFPGLANSITPTVGAIFTATASGYSNVDGTASPMNNVYVKFKKDAGSSNLNKLIAVQDGTNDHQLAPIFGINSDVSDVYVDNTDEACEIIMTGGPNEAQATIIKPDTTLLKNTDGLSFILKATNDLGQNATGLISCTEVNFGNMVNGDDLKVKIDDVEKTFLLFEEQNATSGKLSLKATNPIENNTHVQLKIENTDYKINFSDSVTSHGNITYDSSKNVTLEFDINNSANRGEYAKSTLTIYDGSTATTPGTINFYQVMDNDDEQVKHRRIKLSSVAQTSKVAATSADVIVVNDVISTNQTYTLKGNNDRIVKIEKDKQYIEFTTDSFVLSHAKNESVTQGDVSGTLVEAVSKDDTTCKVVVTNGTFSNAGNLLFTGEERQYTSQPSLIIRGDGSSSTPYLIGVKDVNEGVKQVESLTFTSKMLNENVITINMLDNDLKNAEAPILTTKKFKSSQAVGNKALTTATFIERVGKSFWSTDKDNMSATASELVGRLTLKDEKNDEYTVRFIDNEYPTNSNNSFVEFNVGSNWEHNWDNTYNTNVTTTKASFTLEGKTYYLHDSSALDTKHNDVTIEIADTADYGVKNLENKTLTIFGQTINFKKPYTPVEQKVICLGVGEDGNQTCKIVVGYVDESDTTPTGVNNIVQFSFTRDNNGTENKSPTLTTARKTSSSFYFPSSTLSDSSTVNSNNTAYLNHIERFFEDTTFFTYSYNYVSKQPISASDMANFIISKINSESILNQHMECQKIDNYGFIKIVSKKQGEDSNSVIYDVNITRSVVGNVTGKSVTLDDATNIQVGYKVKVDSSSSTVTTVTEISGDSITLSDNITYSNDETITFTHPYNSQLQRGLYLFVPVNNSNANVITQDVVTKMFAKGTGSGVGYTEWPYVTAGTTISTDDLNIAIEDVNGVILSRDTVITSLQSSLTNLLSTELTATVNNTDKKITISLKTGEAGSKDITISSTAAVEDFIITGDDNGKFTGGTTNDSTGKAYKQTDDGNESSTGTVLTDSYYCEYRKTWSGTGTRSLLDYISQLSHDYTDIGDRPGSLKDIFKMNIDSVTNKLKISYGFGGSVNNTGKTMTHNLNAIGGSTSDIVFTGNNTFTGGDHPTVNYLSGGFVSMEHQSKTGDSAWVNEERLVWKHGITANTLPAATCDLTFANTVDVSGLSIGNTLSQGGSSSGDITAIDSTNKIITIETTHTFNSTDSVTETGGFSSAPTAVSHKVYRWNISSAEYIIDVSNKTPTQVAGQLHGLLNVNLPLLLAEGTDTGYSAANDNSQGTVTTKPFTVTNVNKKVTVSQLTHGLSGNTNNKLNDNPTSDTQEITYFNLSLSSFTGGTESGIDGTIKAEEPENIRFTMVKYTDAELENNTIHPEVELASLENGELYKIISLDSSSTIPGDSSPAVGNIFTATGVGINDGITVCKKVINVSATCAKLKDVMNHANGFNGLITVGLSGNKLTITQQKYGNLGSDKCKVTVASTDTNFNVDVTGSNYLNTSLANRIKLGLDKITDVDMTFGITGSNISCTATTAGVNGNGYKIVASNGTKLFTGGDDKIMTKRVEVDISAKDNGITGNGKRYKIISLDSTTTGTYSGDANKTDVDVFVGEFSSFTSADQVVEGAEFLHDGSDISANTFVGTSTVQYLDDYHWEMEDTMEKQINNVITVLSNNSIVQATYEGKLKPSHPLSGVYSGTPVVDGTNASGISSTTAKGAAIGVGSGATFNISWASGVLSLTVNNQGSGYQVGNIITISSANHDGDSDITVTLTDADINNYNKVTLKQLKYGGDVTSGSPYYSLNSITNGNFEISKDVAGTDFDVASLNTELNTRIMALHNDTSNTVLSAINTDNTQLTVDDTSKLRVGMTLITIDSTDVESSQYKIKSIIGSVIEMDKSITESIIATNILIFKDKTTTITLDTQLTKIVRSYQGVVPDTEKQIINTSDNIKFYKSDGTLYDSSTSGVEWRAGHDNNLTGLTPTTVIAEGAYDVKNKLLNITVNNGGAGYSKTSDSSVDGTSVPATFTQTSTGASISATVTIASGAITSVTLSDIGDGFTGDDITCSITGWTATTPATFNYTRIDGYDMVIEKGTTKEEFISNLNTALTMAFPTEITVTKPDTTSLLITTSSQGQNGNITNHKNYNSRIPFTIDSDKNLQNGVKGKNQYFRLINVSTDPHEESIVFKLDQSTSQKDSNAFIDSYLAIGDSSGVNANVCKVSLQFDSYNNSTNNLHITNPVKFQKSSLTTNKTYLDGTLIKSTSSTKRIIFDKKPEFYIDDKTNIIKLNTGENSSIKFNDSKIITFKTGTYTDINRTDRPIELDETVPELKFEESGNLTLSDGGNPISIPLKLIINTGNASDIITLKDSKFKKQLALDLQTPLEIGNGNTFQIEDTYDVSLIKLSSYNADGWKTTGYSAGEYFSNGTRIYKATAAIGAAAVSFAPTHITGTVDNWEFISTVPVNNLLYSDNNSSEFTANVHSSTQQPIVIYANGYPYDDIKQVGGTPLNLDKKPKLILNIKGNQTGLDFSKYQPYYSTKFKMDLNFNDVKFKDDVITNLLGESGVNVIKMEVDGVFTTGNTLDLNNPTSSSCPLHIKLNQHTLTIKGIFGQDADVSQPVIKVIDNANELVSKILIDKDSTFNGHATTSNVSSYIQLNGKTNFEIEAADTEKSHQITANNNVNYFIEQNADAESVVTLNNHKFVKTGTTTEWGAKQIAILKGYLESQNTKVWDSQFHTAYNYDISDANEKGVTYNNGKPELDIIEHSTGNNTYICYFSSNVTTGCASLELVNTTNILPDALKTLTIGMTAGGNYTNTADSSAVSATGVVITFTQTSNNAVISGTVDIGGGVLQNLTFTDSNIVGFTSTTPSDYTVTVTGWTVNTAPTFTYTLSANPSSEVLKEVSSTWNKAVGYMDNVKINGSPTTSNISEINGSSLNTGNPLQISFKLKIDNENKSYTGGNNASTYCKIRIAYYTGLTSNKTLLKKTLKYRLENDNTTVPTINTNYSSSVTTYTTDQNWRIGIEDSNKLPVITFPLLNVDIENLKDNWPGATNNKLQFSNTTATGELNNVGVNNTTGEITMSLGKHYLQNDDKVFIAMNTVDGTPLSLLDDSNPDDVKKHVGSSFENVTPAEFNSPLTSFKVQLVGTNGNKFKVVNQDDVVILFKLTRMRILVYRGNEQNYNITTPLPLLLNSTLNEIVKTFNSVSSDIETITVQGKFGYVYNHDLYESVLLSGNPWLSINSDNSNIQFIKSAHVSDSITTGKNINATSDMENMEEDTDNFLRSRTTIKLQSGIPLSGSDNINIKINNTDSSSLTDSFNVFCKASTDTDTSRKKLTPSGSSFTLSGTDEKEFQIIVEESIENILDGTKAKATVNTGYVLKLEFTITQSISGKTPSLSSIKLNQPTPEHCFVYSPVNNLTDTPVNNTYVFASNLTIPTTDFIQSESSNKEYSIHTQSLLAYSTGVAQPDVKITLVPDVSFYKFGFKAPPVSPNTDNAFDISNNLFNNSDTNVGTRILDQFKIIQYYDGSSWNEVSSFDTPISNQNIIKIRANKSSTQIEKTIFGPGKIKFTFYKQGDKTKDAIIGTGNEYNLTYKSYKDSNIEIITTGTNGTCTAKIPISDPQIKDTDPDLHDSINESDTDIPAKIQSRTIHKFDFQIKTPTVYGNNLAAVPGSGEICITDKFDVGELLKISGLTKGVLNNSNLDESHADNQTVKIIEIVQNKDDPSNLFSDVDVTSRIYLKTVLLEDTKNYNNYQYKCKDDKVSNTNPYGNEWVKINQQKLNKIQEGSTDITTYTQLAAKINDKITYQLSESLEDNTLQQLTQTEISYANSHKSSLVITNDQSGASLSTTPGDLSDSNVYLVGTVKVSDAKEISIDDGSTNINNKVNISPSLPADTVVNGNNGAIGKLYRGIGGLTGVVHVIQDTDSTADFEDCTWIKINGGSPINISTNPHTSKRIVIDHRSNEFAIWTRRKNLDVADPGNKSLIDQMKIVLNDLYEVTTDPLEPYKLTCTQIIQNQDKALQEAAQYKFFTNIPWISTINSKLTPNTLHANGAFNISAWESPIDSINVTYGGSEINPSFDTIQANSTDIGTANFGFGSNSKIIQSVTLNNNLNINKYATTPTISLKNYDGSGTTNPSFTAIMGKSECTIATDSTTNVGDLGTQSSLMIPIEKIDPTNNKKKYDDLLIYFTPNLVTDDPFNKLKNVLQVVTKSNIIREDSNNEITFTSVNEGDIFGLTITKQKYDILSVDKILTTQTTSSDIDFWELKSASQLSADEEFQIINNHRQISGITITSGGTNYTVNDELTLSVPASGGLPAKVKVTSVDGVGAITGHEISENGSGYMPSDTITVYSSTVINNSAAGVTFTPTLGSTTNYKHISNCTDNFATTTTWTVNSSVEPTLMATLGGLVRVKTTKTHTNIAMTHTPLSSSSTTVSGITTNITITDGVFESCVNSSTSAKSGLNINETLTVDINSVKQGVYDNGYAIVGNETRTVTVTLTSDNLDLETTGTNLLNNRKLRWSNGLLNKLTSTTNISITPTKTETTNILEVDQATADQLIVGMYIGSKYIVEITDDNKVILDSNYTFTDGTPFTFTLWENIGSDDTITNVKTTDIRSGFNPDSTKSSQGGLYTWNTTTKVFTTPDTTTLCSAIFPLNQNAKTTIIYTKDTQYGATVGIQTEPATNYTNKHGGTGSNGNGGVHQYGIVDEETNPQHLQQGTHTFSVDIPNRKIIHNGIAFDFKSAIGQNSLVYFAIWDVDSHSSGSVTITSVQEEESVSTKLQINLSDESVITSTVTHHFTRYNELIKRIKSKINDRFDNLTPELTATTVIDNTDVEHNTLKLTRGINGIFSNRVTQQGNALIIGEKDTNIDIIDDDININGSKTNQHNDFLSGAANAKYWITDSLLKSDIDYKIQLYDDSSNPIETDKYVITGTTSPVVDTTNHLYTIDSENTYNINLANYNQNTNIYVRLFTHSFADTLLQKLKEDNTDGVVNWKRVSNMKMLNDQTAQSVLNVLVGTDPIPYELNKQLYMTLGQTAASALIYTHKPMKVTGVSGGSGYVLDEELTLSVPASGGSVAKVKVTSVDGGIITNVTVINGGSGYEDGEAVTVDSSTGAGTGTVTITLGDAEYYRLILNNGTI